MIPAWYSSLVSREVDGDSRDAEAGRVFDAYLAEIEAGKPADPQELLAAHPDLAGRLQACLDMLGWANRLADGVDVPSGLVLGDFRVIREIGRGGMAVVYEAEQVSLRRRVALKVLPFAATLDRNQLVRFQIEAQAAAQLHHTNIVPVFAVGHERGIHFYAMQLIEGHGLDASIRALRQFEEAGETGTTGGAVVPSWLTNPSMRSQEFMRTVAHLGIQAAEALDHAHSLGIVHRDIKPANLIVDVRGNLWVTDFGLARMQAGSGLTVTGDVLGTLRYMSPEQLHAKREVVDHRTDIYSLGATLYHLLTLRPVYDCQDRAELARQTSLQEPVAPRRLNRAIPRDLETVVMKAMARDVGQRYATARELSDDLRRFLDDRPVRARRPSVLRRFNKIVRRHKFVIASAATVLLILLTSSAVILTQRQHNRGLEKIERTRLYAHDIQAASYLVERRRLTQASEILARYRPKSGEEDVRNFPWFHLWRVCNYRPEIWPGHSDSIAKTVYRIAVSPEGDYLASCGADGTVKLWGLKNGQLLRTFRGHLGEVNFVCFSPDGTKLATGGDDATVRLWSLPGSDDSIILGRHDGRVLTVDFTPDGRRLLSASYGGQLKIWDLATLREEVFFKSSPPRVEAAGTSRDGRYLITGASEAPIRIWDFGTGRELPGFPGRDVVEAGALSHDGRRIALAYHGGTITIWDFARREALATCRNSGGRVEQVAFSPDDRTFAYCDSDGKIRLRETNTGDLLQTYCGQAGWVWSVAFSRDGRTLMSGGEDGLIRRWDLAQPQDRRVISLPDALIMATAFPKGSETLIVVSRPIVGDSRELTITRWNLERGARIDTKVIVSPGPFHDCKFSTDGGLLCTVAENPCQIKLWDAATGQLKRQVPAFEGSEMSHYGYLSVVEGFISHRRINKLTNADMETIIWDTGAGRIKTRPGYFDLFLRLPQSHRILARERSGWTEWDPVTDRVTPSEISDRIAAKFVKSSPDGRLLAAERDDSIELMDWQTLQNAGNLICSAGNLKDLNFSPDNEILASVEGSGTVRLWDMTLREELLTLQNPLPFAGDPQSLHFSPDGSCLVRAVWQANRKASQLIVWLAARPEG